MKKFSLLAILSNYSWRYIPIIHLIENYQVFPHTYIIQLHFFNATIDIKMMKENSDLKSFESLKVWQLSREIRNDIFELCKSFPSEEKYKLSDQMIRASRSIGNNISEGYGRYHYQENIQYCRQSRGSAYELVDHLITALDCGYIQTADFNSLKGKIEECIKMTNGYISYLNREKLNNTARESSVNFFTDG